MIYNEWQTYYLDQLYDFKSGLSKSRKEFGFGERFLTFKEVFHNYFLPEVLNNLANTNSTEQQKSSIKKGDVFLTRTSEKLEELGMSSVALKSYDKATFNGFTKRLRPNKKAINLLLPEYAGFYFRSNRFRNQVTSMATMTTRASLNNLMLSKLTIDVPPLIEQKRITALLNSLHKKINLNNSIIYNLEELTQTLFKHWFVDFEFPDEDGKPYKSNGGKMVESELGLIPEGWSMNSLKDITSKFCTGLNPRKNFKLGEGSNYYVTIKNMHDNQIILDEKCDKVTDDAIEIINKRSDLQKNDMLFSGIGTIGRVHLISEAPYNWNISESIFTLRSNNLVTTELLYLILLSKNLQDYAQQLSSGSVQKGIRKRDLEKYQVALPGLEKIESFSSIIRPFIKKTQFLTKEKHTLTEVRDNLLPKLLSGEIELPDNMEVDEDVPVPGS